MSETLESLHRRIEELERDNEDLRCELSASCGRELDLLAILSNAPAPSYLKEAELKYIRGNRMFEELARVKTEQLRGKSDYDIFPKPVAELFREQDEQVIREGRAIEFEETIPLPDGEFTFITIKFPVHDKDGKLRAVGGFCTDITVRKRAERDREELIAKLKATLDEVATLQKILPICSCCRRIRDGHGDWCEIEAYLLENAELEFSHSVCPECSNKLYGGQKWFVERKQP